MSSKKNQPTQKKSEPLSAQPKKINLVLINGTNDAILSALQIANNQKNVDLVILKWNDIDLEKISKSGEKEIAYTPVQEIDKVSGYLLIDLDKINALDDLKNWLSNKGITTNTKLQKLAYSKNFFNTEVSKASLLCNADWFLSLKELISNGIPQKVVVSSVFSPYIHCKIVSVPSAISAPEENILKKFVSLFQSITLNAWKEIKSWPIGIKSDKVEHPIWKFGIGALLIAGFIYLILGGIHAGIGGDEYRYINQAEKVTKFYTSFGKDTSAYTKAGIDPQHYNGQILDNFMYIIGKPFGLEKNFAFRHSITASTCWLGILCAVLTAMVLFNFKVAFLTTLFLFLTPIFIGNGFNNHRDIPLVTGIMTATLGLSLLRNIYPLFSKKYLLLVILGVFLSFGQRIAGGIMAGFLMVVFCVFVLIEKSDLNKLLKFDVRIWQWVGGISLATVIGILLAFLSWPFGLVNPIKHAYEVYSQSGNLSVALYQIFESKYKLSSQMPDYYVLKYISITVPAMILIGVLITSLFFFNKKFPWPKPIVVFFFIAFLFPLIYSYFKLGNMYGSWRHFLFVYPFITISAALGWEFALLQSAKIKSIYYSIGIVLLLLIHPLQYILRNHPFEYLYYNEIMGGTGGAYGKYEWDYSLNSLKQGAEWLQKYIRKNHPKGTKLLIASNGGLQLEKYFEGFDSSVTTVYTRYYEKGAQNWDYAIFPNMYIHPYQLKNHIYSKGDSLHFIMLDGEPLTFIFKRNNRNDYNASQAISRNDIPAAVTELNEYLKYNPKSEWGWFQLAYMYAQQSDYNTAQNYLNEAFKWHPEFLPARALQGLVYQNTGRCKEAQPLFLGLISDKYDLFNSYKWSGICYETDGNWRKALEQYGFALGAGNTQNDTYARIANCFRKLGDNTQAAKYEAMAK